QGCRAYVVERERLEQRQPRRAPPPHPVLVDDGRQDQVRVRQAERRVTVATKRRRDRGQTEDDPEPEVHGDTDQYASGSRSSRERATKRPVLHGAASSRAGPRTIQRSLGVEGN